jgi:hypothetical protein
VLPALAGCGGTAGTLARLFSGDAVDPIFKPQDRLTLIVVEQDPGPDGPVLGDPSLSGVIAQQIKFQLKNEEAITQFVAPEKLAEVQKQTGDKFQDLSDTELARKLGAAQVLRVRVRSTGISEETGNLRPQAVVFVWLTDAVTNQVIFPVPGTGNDAVAPEAQTGPYVVTSTINHKSASGDNSSGLIATLERQLAERIGRDVARLFFSYVPDNPGTP